MDEKSHRLLVWVALALGVLFVGWTMYDGFYPETEESPGNSAYHAANKFFEDANYSRALEEYQRALLADPAHEYALRGKALTLMQLQKADEALEILNQILAQGTEHPASIYANRGILHDRQGDYEQAIADYDKALILDAEIAKGPNWLDRFFRLQTQKPPGIAERSAYLKVQLAKPEAERLLRKPEEDAKQRSYQQ